MASAGLADYRVVFATPGTPPRKFRDVRLADDLELADWLVYVDGSGREVCRLNRDVVLFVERLNYDDSDGGEITESQPAAVVVVNGPLQPDGLAGVAAAVRSARGGAAPAQIRGFA